MGRGSEEVGGRHLLLLFPLPHSPDLLLFSILPPGRSSEDGLGAAFLCCFTPPLPLTYSSSISYPRIGLSWPDTTEVIIKLLSVQWNSHEVTSSVKRNKIENTIHPDC